MSKSLIRVTPIRVTLSQTDVRFNIIPLTKNKKLVMPTSYKVCYSMSDNVILTKYEPNAKVKEFMINVYSFTPNHSVTAIA